MVNTIYHDLPQSTTFHQRAARRVGGVIDRSSVGLFSYRFCEIPYMCIIKIGLVYGGKACATTDYHKDRRKKNISARTHTRMRTRGRVLPCN